MIKGTLAIDVFVGAKNFLKFKDRKLRSMKDQNKCTPIKIRDEYICKYMQKT